MARFSHNHRMLDLDNFSPAQYRERYHALQARARANTAPDLSTPPAIPAAAVIARETIPPGWYAPIRLKRGEAIHIVNPHAAPGGSLFLWNADDPSERYNAADTVKLQWTTLIGAGRVLFSDMGRILAAIIAANTGTEPILGPSTPQTANTGRNGRDNLRSAAAKFGLGRRDVGSSLNLFAQMRVDTQGRPHLAPPPPPGAFITLRAEMNLLIALSNTPHPLAPDQAAAGPLETTRYRAPPPAETDPCRRLSEEAIRGYENNDRYFA